MQAAQNKDIGGLTERGLCTTEKVSRCRCAQHARIDAERDDHTTLQAKWGLSASLLVGRGVVDGRGTGQHLSNAQAPEHLFAPSFLAQTPGVERTKWAHDIRHASALARSGSGQARMREDGVNVDRVELTNV